MEIISELYVMNRWRREFVCFQWIISSTFFPEKKIPKQIFARVLWTCLDSFTSWLKVLKEGCRIPQGDILAKAWKSSLPCHSPPLSNNAYSDFYVRGIKGWEVSLFLVVMGFNKYYYCTIRLQPHQNFKKHYFVLWKTSKKRLSLEIFFAVSCKWKHLLKISSMKSSHISREKKKLLYTWSHNYAESNGKLKKSQCKTKEGKYCTLAENLFHR